MTDRSGPPLRAVRIAAKCPICAKPADEKYQPFCTKRCADIDLGRWLKGSYVIPGEAVEETETGLPPRERDEEA